MRRKNKNIKLAFPAETVKEFLKRGGEISKLDYIKPELKKHIIKSTTFKIPKLYTLLEGAHMFCEKIKRKRKKPKKQIEINVNMLPKELRYLITKNG